MTKGKQLMKDLLQAGLMTAVVAVALPDMSWAQQSDLGTTTSTFAKSELSGIPGLISAGCYIGGVLMMVSGSLKLKAHAEKPDQEKLAPGVSRLTVGAALAALPTALGWIRSSSQIGGSSITYSTLSSGF
jgi:hypothetical protein